MAGEWFVDDIDLGLCAFAVKNRSATWYLPERRGENYKVPGRDGTIWNGNKPLGENIVNLEMFAAGAESDGSMPAAPEARVKVLENLDTLTRLFGRPGLREVVKAYTDDYNRVNLIPNPSMENAGQKIVLRENVINNPSGEFSDGDIVVRRNFVDNPGMESATAEETFRTNLVRNPRMAGESDPVVLLRNWVPNPSLEAGLRFWRTQGTNSRIFSSRQTRVGGTWPAQGQKSLRMVALGTGNAVVECTSIEVNPGQAHTFSGYVWNRCEDVRTCRMFVRYFNKTGAFISATSNVDVVVGIEGTTRLVQTDTPPANAATAAIRFALVSAEQDDVMYVDAAMVSRTSSVRDYFDGDTEEQDGLRYRWVDAGGRSTSQQYVVAPRGWYSPISDATPEKTRLSCSTEYATRGSQSGKIEVLAATAANDIVLRQTVAAGCRAIEGDWVSGSIAVRLSGVYDDSLTVTNKQLTSNVATLTVGAHSLDVGYVVVVAGVDATFNGTYTLTAVTATTISYAKVASNVASTASGGTVTRPARTVKLNLQCWDSNGDFLGVVKVSAGGADKSDVTLELSAGNWQRVEIETGYVIPDTAKVTLRIACNEAWGIGDEVYFDAAIVEPVKKIGEWFDGNLPDDDTFIFDWEGDPHWSQSIQRGRNIQAWVAREGRQYQAADGYLREYALKLVPFRDPDSTARPRIESQALDMRPGRKHMLSAWVNLSRSHSIRLGVSYDDGETWTYGGATSPTVATWTRLSFGFTIAADADPETTWIAVASNAAPVDGDEILIDAVLFEPCEGLRRYFDGDSGTQFQWSDDEERSESWRVLDRPNGWHGWGSGFPIVRRLAIAGSQGTHLVRSVASQAGTMGVTFAQDGIDSELDYAFGIDLKPSATKNGYVAIVWLDEEGEQVGIAQSATTSLTSASYTRKTVTGSPPADATVGVPIAVVEGAVMDDHVDFDGAIFGFGAATDFKDGDSGGGWEWIGVRGFSESEQIGVGVDYWGSVNGTLARNGAWSSNRDFNATYTVTNASGPCYLYAFGTGRDDERRYKLRPKDPLVTFAVTVKAVDAGKVQLKLLLSRWRAQGWQPSTAPVDPEGAQIDFTAGEEKRLTLTVDTSTFDIGDATHFRPAVFLYDTAGGPADLGQVVRVDSASCSRDTENDYQDGTFEYVLWTGDPDASHSKRVGPARRIFGERLQGTDFASLGGGQVAEFAVQLVAPGVYWEDAIQKTQRLAIPRKGGTLLFDKFEGSTAPLNDATITVNGPINDFTLTDVGSGTWIRMNMRLADDQSIVIDNDDWIVRWAHGKKRRLFDRMTHSGHSVLLPLTTRSDETVPRLRIDADSIGRGAFITVVARRKFMVA